MPGVAVGLELEAHRQVVGVAGAGLLLAAHLVARAEEVLHVVAELVGEHVDAGEVAGRAELALELLEEREVDVGVLVGRAVEGPDRRRGVAAAARAHARR